MKAIWKPLAEAEALQLQELLPSFPFSQGKASLFFPLSFSQYLSICLSPSEVDTNPHVKKYRFHVDKRSEGNMQQAYIYKEWLTSLFLSLSLALSLTHINIPVTGSISSILTPEGSGGPGWRSLSPWLQRHWADCECVFACMCPPLFVCVWKTSCVPGERLI